MLGKSAIYVLKANLADLAATHTAIDPAIDLRWIEPDERHLILDSPYRPENRTGPEFFERHFADNGRACAALVDGDLVAWRLFKPGFQRTFYWLEVRSGDKAVYGMAAFTAPQARGKRLMAILTAFAARDYLTREYTTMMATANCNNAAAVAAHAHMGMQTISSVVSTRWPLGFRSLRINAKLKAGFYNRRRPLIHYVS